MIYRLLTGDPRPDFRALGVGGVPVTDYSRQIDALLRLRGLQHVADCFAVPLTSTLSPGLRWHSPRPGDICPWAEAGIPERRQAIGVLRQAIAELNTLSAGFRAGGESDGCFFARLLEKMVSFPGTDVLWLIDNQPVIAYWGFNRTEDTVSSADILRSAEEQLPPLPDGTLPAEQQTLLPLPATEEALITSPRSSRALNKTGLAAAMAGAILLAALAGYHLWPGPPEESMADTTPARLTIVTTSLPPGAPVSLPLQRASLLPPVVIPAPPKPLVKTEPERQRLQIPASAMKLGKINFMDGRWQAEIRQTPDSLPLTLKYRFQHGRGTVQVNSSRGICRAESSSGFLPSGVLSLRSRFRAICRAGDRLKVPVITCSRSAQATLCSAGYDNDKQSQTVTLFCMGVR